MQVYSGASVAVQSASEHQESLSESSVAVQSASGQWMSGTWGVMHALWQR